MGAYIFIIVMSSSWIFDHYVVSLASFHNLYFKVYLILYECCYSCFLLVSILMEHLFPPLHFQSACVPWFDWVSCRQHIWGSCFCIHSASLCLLDRAFNPFILVIIEKYDAIAITLLFWVQIYKPFLCFLSREDPLAFVQEMVWWC